MLAGYLWRVTSAWRPYDRSPNTVVGDLRVYAAVPGPVPGRTRELYAWLPPGYESDGERRYPVVYLQDGHSLFDRYLKAETDDPSMHIEPGEWEVDETMTALHDEGLDAIVVGIPNAGADRVLEYTPWCDIEPDLARAIGVDAASERGRVPGQGAAYVDWVCDVVKPLVDASFRTLTGREHTTVGGSSLGGIISLLAYRQRPEVFGAAGVFSPAFWVLGPDSVEALASDLPSGRVYLDIGGQESPEVSGLPSRYELDARRAADLLDRQPQVDLKFVVDPEGRHHETAWAARLPEAMRFLLGPGR